MRRLQTSRRDSRATPACRQQPNLSETFRLSNCRPAVHPHDMQQASHVDNDHASQCNSQTSSAPQLVSWSHRRTALLQLVALGLSPLLGVVPRAAAAESTLSGSSSSGTGPDAPSGPSLDTQQGSGLTDESQGGAAGQAADSAAADSLQRDDSPSQVFEDGEDSSSSSSSSSSSESDSSSGSDSESSSDEEPGELFASSDDNNAAGGSSSSSSSGTSDKSDGGSSTTGDGSSNTTSSSIEDSTSTSTSSGSSGEPSTSSSTGGSTGNSRTATRTTMGPNLSVPSYIQILQDSRRSSWPLLAQKIQAGEWIELSQLLVQAPFDAVRQACFYIPWALLQSDDFDAAVAARKAYVDYIDHVHALAAIALKAADGVPGADLQVQQAFTLMNASLNAFLSAVPVKYQRYRI